jgi:uncharacterized membrane protein YqjE
MLALSEESAVKLRFVAYVGMTLAFITFCVGTVVALTEEIRCLTDLQNPDICTIEGFRSSENPHGDDDYQWHGKQTYINSNGAIRNPGDQSLGMYITMLFISINAFVGFSLSMIVVWLVDHRATPNGFTRLVQWFSIVKCVWTTGSSSTAIP